MNRRSLLASISALLFAPEALASVSIMPTRGVPFVVDRDALTISLDEYAKRYIAPAMAQLVKQIGYDVLFGSPHAQI